MQYRRSRTDNPCASPFSVRSSIDIRLPTVVYARQQTPLVVGALPVNLILTYPPALLDFSSRRPPQRYNSIEPRPPLTSPVSDISWNDNPAFSKPFARSLHASLSTGFFLSAYEHTIRWSPAE